MRSVADIRGSVHDVNIVIVFSEVDYNRHAHLSLDMHMSTFICGCLCIVGMASGALRSGACLNPS